MNPYFQLIICWTLCFFFAFSFLQLFDEEEDLRTKVRQLAEAMRQARHVVIYTGAGISTVPVSLLPVLFTL